VDRPTVTPQPAIAHGVGLPWDVACADPVAALAAAREQLGDTFVVDSGDDRYLFTFSAVGVASFYALDEADASKGMADWRMLRRKVPHEVFAGRRTLPHALFGRDDAAAYLANLERALDVALEELGAEGQLNVFAFTRRLGHRMGLASWGGPGASAGERFNMLADAFDVLDGAESFVHPDAMTAVAKSGHAAERDALAGATALIGLGLDDHSPGDDLFSRIVDRWEGEAENVRRTGIAHDVVLVHIASMSNLFAALGWSIVDLVEHPDERAAVAAGDAGLAEHCALESTRLAQRSIMSRYVLRDVELDVGDATLTVEAGTTIATLLPLTNSSAAPGLDRWDPRRWHRHRLADSASLPAVELVTAFGHGRHSCPAQSFSLGAMRSALLRLTSRYSLDPIWTQHPVPVPAQIGGVARSADPCLLRYRRLARR
jgi:cytochrome P450